MKNIIALFLLCVPLTLSACSSNENSVFVPFSSSDYQGENYQNVIAELQDAGFTNIDTDTMLTYSDSKVDVVGTITIDGNHLFRKNDKYSSDVPVVISYYYMDESPSVDEPEVNPTTKPETNPTTEPESIYTADAVSIKQLAEDKFCFEYEDLSVSWDDFDEAYVVSFFPTALPADETAWVYSSINRYIKFCQFAYEIEDLERLRFDIAASGSDQYGNTITFEGLSVLMTREYFALYNWENLSYTGIWDTFVDNCYVFSLSPVFSSSLDSSKIFYDPYLRNGLID